MARDEVETDPVAMCRLAKALACTSGPGNPTGLALGAGVESRSDRVVKTAQQLFLQLKTGDRMAALAMISGST